MTFRLTVPAAATLGMWLSVCLTGHGQTPASPSQQPPVFRAGVRLVRVDVSATGKGDRPVADLQASDFEVTEDGVPQKVEQLQFIRLDGNRPPGEESSLDIRSQDQAAVEAAREDVRIFAIFLDDYHIDRAPDITIPLRRALTTFINQLWPTDLVAVMDPLTPLSALRFTRSKPDLLDIVRKFEGRQGEIYPIKSVMEEAQLAHGDVRRLRAEVTLSALSSLVVRLGGLREGRKSVLFVSQGPPVYLGRSEGDLQHLMSEVTDGANRGNVSIHALDPRGLGLAERLGVRTTLFQLSGDTGGRTITNTNDHAGGLMRVLGDNTAYYVLGYTPIRTQDDGKYHKISVKVKRPGVHVLARQGYWAPSAQQVEAAAAAARKPAVPGVDHALETLAPAETRQRVVETFVGLSRGVGRQAAVTVTWDTSEPIRTAVPASLDVEVLPAKGGQPIRPVRTLGKAGSGSSVPTSVAFALDPGDVLVQFTARAGDGSLVDRWTQPLSVPDFTASVLRLSTARFFRARSSIELRGLLASQDPVPTPARQFSRGDRVLVAVDCYAEPGGEEPTIEAHFLTRDGRELAALSVPPLEQTRLRFELPLSSLGQGTYILRLRARLGQARAEEMTAIRIIP